MNLRALTPAQRKMFNYIKFLLDTRGYGPTIREAGDWFGWTGILWQQKLMKDLVRKGWLERDAYKARGIRLSETYKQWEKETYGKAKA